MGYKCLTIRQYPILLLFLWLAIRAGKMARSCSSGLPAVSRKKTVFIFPYNKSSIDQACSVKMAGYWPVG